MSGGAFPGDLASGDEAVIESQSPRYRHELVQLASQAQFDQGVTFFSPLVHSYPSELGRVMLRWRDYYPALRLPIAERKRDLMVTHTWRSTYVFRATLEAPPRGIHRLLLGYPALEGYP